MWRVLVIQPLSPKFTGKNVLVECTPQESMRNSIPSEKYFPILMTTKVVFI